MSQAYSCPKKADSALRRSTPTSADRRGSEGKNEDGERGYAKRRAARTECLVVDDCRVPMEEEEEGQNSSPKPPTRPARPKTERNQREDEQTRQPKMLAGEERIEDVAAIELPDRQQIQGRRQQAAQAANATGCR